MSKKIKQSQRKGKLQGPGKGLGKALSYGFHEHKRDPEMQTYGKWKLRVDSLKTPVQVSMAQWVELSKPHLQGLSPL